MADARVLIVEDEVIVAMGLERSLGSFGYDVVGLATKGEDALRMAGELQPDIALIDINLEDTIDGIDVAGKIDDMWNIPVVYLTSYTGDETLSRAIQTNPYGYLTKPARPREIYTTIETVLQKHRAITAEREVESKGKMYEALLNSVPYPLCTVSMSGESHVQCFLEANEKFFEYSQISAGELSSADPGYVFGDFVRDFLDDPENPETAENSGFLMAADGNPVSGKVIMHASSPCGKMQVCIVFVPDKGTQADHIGGTGEKKTQYNAISLINSIKQPLSAIIAISGLKGGMEFEEISKNAEKIQSIISGYEG